MFIAFLLFVVAVALLWFIEVKLSVRTALGKNAGARVSGPLFSMSASGTIGKAVTYGIWKGQPWARVWFKPENPNSDKQINVRYAMKLIVAFWGEVGPLSRDKWDAFAEQFGMSGFNQLVKRAMLEYVVQITTAVKPQTVAYAADVPVEVWTWT